MSASWSGLNSSGTRENSPALAITLSMAPKRATLASTQAWAVWGSAAS